MKRKELSTVIRVVGVSRTREGWLLIDKKESMKGQMWVLCYRCPMIGSMCDGFRKGGRRNVGMMENVTADSGGICNPYLAIEEWKRNR